MARIETCRILHLYPEDLKDWEPGLMEAIDYIHCHDITAEEFQNHEAAPAIKACMNPDGVIMFVQYKLPG